MKSRLEIKGKLEKDSKYRTYNPTRINSYIEWLEAYDKFLKIIKDRFDEDKLTIDNGAYIKPDEIPYREFVTHEEAIIKCREIIITYLKQLFRSEIVKQKNMDIEINENIKRKPRNFIKNLEKLKHSKIADFVNRKISIIGDNNIDTSFLNSKFLDFITQADFNSLEPQFDNLNIASSSLIREDLRKSFENQVKEATLLIQNVPNIQFGVVRVEHIDETDEEE
jgi:hypothetical protein